MVSQQNEFMTAIQQGSQHFIQILTENTDWILAVPPPDFFTKRKLVIDEACINEHILQISFDGKEMTTLAGKTFKVESEKKLRCQETGVQVLIMSKDSYFAMNNKEVKRMFVSNCLDPRFYSDEEDVERNEEEKRMRDPYEMIQFFKSEVYHDLEDEYLEVLEDIKILKENHILLYNNF